MALKTWLYVLALSLCWGPSYLAIKIATEDIPPCTLAFFRVLIGFISLLCFVIIKNKDMPFSTTYRKKYFNYRVIIVSILSTALPFTLFPIGERYISSALASIINGITPIVSVIFGYLWIQNEVITKTKLLGIGSGFLGFLLLLLPTLIDGSIEGDTIGILAIFCACSSYGMGMAYAKKHFSSTQGIFLPLMQLFFASLLLLGPASFEILQTDIHISFKAFISLLFLGVIGSAIAFVIYYKIIELGGLMAISMVPYLLPLVGTFLGVILFQEPFQRSFFAAFPCLFLGMFLVSKRPIEKTALL